MSGAGLLSSSPGVTASPRPVDGARPASAAGSAARRRLAVAGCIAGGLVTLGMCWYHLAQPRVLYGVVQYDDGVYLGSALQLAAGKMPYKDFTLIQPPGVPVLMLPIALLGHLTGSRVAMALARIVTAGVCVLDTVLAGWIVRHRGPLAALGAAGLFALFPSDFSANRTLLLEPYLVLFVLAGTGLAFRGDRLAGRRRLVWAGVVFGIAGTTKIWAVFPFAALVLVLLVWRTAEEAPGSPEAGSAQSFAGAGPRSQSSARASAGLPGAAIRGGVTTAFRRRVVPFVAGTAAGFAVLCGPFIAADPPAFWRDVVVAQFARTTARPTPVGQRLGYIAGAFQTLLAPRSNDLGTKVALGLGAFLVLALVLPLVARRASALEAFVVLGAASAVGIMFVPHTFYSHYSLFPDAFLALALALAFDRCRRIVARQLRLGDSLVRRRIAVAVCGAAGLGALIGCGILVGSETGWARTSLHSVGDPGPSIASVLPARACVLSDAASVLIAANRYSTASSCPAVVDPTGITIAVDPNESAIDKGAQLTTAGDPALDSRWEHMLSGADYLVTLKRVSDRLPWDPVLLAWFARHYRLAAVSGAFVFENRNPPAFPA